MRTTIMVDMEDLKGPNPWHPIKDAVDLKHLGKLGEELSECGSAVCRCIIQGIDEREPVTQKLNKHWLEDEIADVYANLSLVVDRFHLNLTRIQERRDRKIEQLRKWHEMV